MVTDISWYFGYFWPSDTPQCPYTNLSAHIYFGLYRCKYARTSLCVFCSILYTSVWVSGFCPRRFSDLVSLFLGDCWDPSSCYYWFCVWGKKCFVWLIIKFEISTNRKLVRMWYEKSKFACKDFWDTFRVLFTCLSWDSYLCIFNFYKLQIWNFYLFLYFE